ncbi:MAG: primosomal protein N' [Deltaproteobacteria bacterium]|nr:MAG: primosomal protein N' [Deltaproteobacteria bacterium]
MTAEPRQRDDIVEVAVGLPVRSTFHYLIPASLRGEVALGKRVLVPFRFRHVTGYVVGFPPKLAVDSAKEVVEVLDEEPLFNSSLLELCRWISNYYFGPLGEVLRAALPSGLDVASCVTYEVTEAGRAALAEGNADEEEAWLLSYLIDHPKAKRSTLLWRTPKRANALRRIERRGWIVQEAGFLTPRVQIKERMIVSLPPPQSDPARERRLGRKQAEVVRILREAGGHLPFETLRAHLAVTPRYIRQMAEKGYLLLRSEEVFRGEIGRGRALPPPQLTPDQEGVFARISTMIATERFETVLLHGITGSGKTEVYLRAIERVLTQGRQVLVLVPEISLTLQFIDQLQGRLLHHFGDTQGIAVLHSGLSDAERYDQWRRILSGHVQIAVGARSAIFAPFSRLGLIVVDEEHDSAYKEEKGFFYNARDVAIVRGKQAGALVLLGSATPSLESAHNGMLGKYVSLTLPERVEKRPLPAVEIIDMRAEPKGSRLSCALTDALLQTVAQKHQAFILINRRGYATFLLCVACGFTYRCPNCSVTLTFHKERCRLQCHYCGHERGVDATCPACGGVTLQTRGSGTERIEEELLRILPNAVIARLDRDVTNRRGALAGILTRMRRHEIDILVGTQMIAKGHDFPNVTLVGVVSADSAMHLPDFRASERTFQLLTQVAGRAGRGDQPGRVLIQTFHPDHYAILHARDHDFAGFFKTELALRQELAFPPFTRIVNFKITGSDLEATERTAASLGELAHGLQGAHPAFSAVECFGPMPAPLARIKARHRFQIVLKGHYAPLHAFVDLLLQRSDALIRGNVHLGVDVDPQSML